ncbi:hypothetical protein L6R52_13330 [Myxococcota bacterium]|nr:hypothetical protein [Myxococcota bacterium]
MATTSVRLRQLCALGWLVGSVGVAVRQNAHASGPGGCGDERRALEARIALKPPARSIVAVDVGVTRDDAHRRAIAELARRLGFFVESDERATAREHDGEAHVAVSSEVRVVVPTLLLRAAVLDALEGRQCVAIAVAIDRAAEEHAVLAEQAEAKKLEARARKALQRGRFGEFESYHRARAASCARLAAAAALAGSPRRCPSIPLVAELHRRVTLEHRAMKGATQVRASAGGGRPASGLTVECMWVTGDSAQCTTDARGMCFLGRANAQSCRFSIADPP